LNAARRHAIVSAAVTLAGIVLSGPVSLALVTLHPQPAWVDAQTFAHAYHPIQALPYFTGFLLVGGSLYLIAALHALADERLRPRATAALGFAAAFAALIFLNYIVQTTFVPALARGYTRDSAPLIAALAMSNPEAVAWAIEMWGYAVLGVATWLIAPVFGDGRGIGEVTRALFIANGPVSLVGAVWTALRPGWVMTAAGLALFAAWNLLMVVMLAACIAALRRPPPDPL
jgi:hypothetical protein